MLYTVLTPSRSKALSRGLTYEGPDGLSPGTHVRVPLRSQIVEGMISEILEHRDSGTFDLKSILEVLPGPGLLPHVQLQAAQMIAEHCVCSLRQAVQLFLPPKPWSSVLPRPQKYYSLVADTTESPKGKQILVIDYLRQHGETPEHQLLEGAGVSQAILSGALKKGLVHMQKRIPEEQHTSVAHQVRDLPELSAEQKRVYEAIAAEKRPSLLFGVTGSGKTEIYAHLIADALKAGKTAVLLSAEIFLAEHLFPRLEKLLPASAIAVIHSKQSVSEQRETWRRIRRGEVSLVLGARSALFAPLTNIGVIILDEEHEWTYKSEQTPRYHARDVAETLCTLSSAKLVLGSATPSLESWSKAKAGTYHMATLSERFKSAPMPVVTVLDLATADFGNHYPFTKPLIEAISSRLEKKEQCVLFLNHRGSASALLCMQCRRRIVSPGSQLPFTVHHGQDGRPFLLDHSSGMTAPVPSECPHCGSLDMKEVGAGTQRIEASLAKLFPGARVLRADRDTLSSVEEMQKVLTKMQNGEADILVGTQTVTKGLDLPRVTLAAVLVADIGMSLPHFRAGERTFQLLMQLTGRSGRHAPGEVIIQTFRPDALEVQSAALHDAARYLDTELKLRAAMSYPPAMHMVRLILRGEGVKERALNLKKDLESKATEMQLKATVTAAPTFFSAGKEWHVLVRADSYRALLQAIKSHDAVIDVDPLETL